MSALSDLVVLDVSRVLAGPYCAQLFADQGAEVIKIESLEGDPSRKWPIMSEGLSTTYLSVNRNKKSITLNLSVPEGRDMFYRLVAKADVLIHNYLPATAAKLGIDDQALHQINPELVSVSVSGYGAKGAHSDKAGYDTMVTAYSGIMSLTGERDGPLVKPGISAIDLTSGILAYAGAVTALMARGRGGVRGQRVDVSLLETAVTLLGVHALNWLIAGKVDGPEGANYGSIVPYGRYRCLDGAIMLGAPDQKAWLRLCDALDATEIKANPLYASGKGRYANEPALRRDLEDLLGTRPVAEWIPRLDRANIPNAPIQTVDQVMQDPQVLANGMVVETHTPDGRTLPLLGLPFKLSETRGEIGTAPPALGQHNAEVFRKFLAITDAELDDLSAAGVI